MVPRKCAGESTVRHDAASQQDSQTHCHCLIHTGVFHQPFLLNAAFNIALLSKPSSPPLCCPPKRRAVSRRKPWCLLFRITRQFNAKKLNCEEILRLKIIAIKHYLFGNGRTVV
jgi:hypothetical protein